MIANMPAASASCRGRSNSRINDNVMAGLVPAVHVLTAGVKTWMPGPMPARRGEVSNMDAGVFAQYVMNGLMLGMMYALVAVGFTLFFGVLDVIKFSHGDVLTVGAFAALAAFIGLQGIGLKSSWLDLAVMIAVATSAMALLGMLIARTLVMPLRS